MPATGDLSQKLLCRLIGLNYRIHFASKGQHALLESGKKQKPCREQFRYGTSGVECGCAAYLYQLSELIFLIPEIARFAFFAMSLKVPKANNIQLFKDGYKVLEMIMTAILY